MEQSEKSGDTWLVTLSSLPLIGDWVATIAGLLPLFFLVALVEQTGATYGGWYFLIAGIVLIPWLRFLERWQNLRVNVPYIPVKLIWITPLFIVGGLGDILGFWKF